MNKGFKILRTIGKELRGIRNSKEISLAEVAEQAGVSTMYISEIERDIKVPSDDLIEKLAVIYKVEEVELFEGFGKLTEGMTNEVVNNKDLFELIFNIVENPNITEKEKSEFYRNIHQQYVKMCK